MTDDDRYSTGRRRSGCLIKGFVTFLAIAILGVLAAWTVGDRVLRQRVEREVADELSREYNLVERPIVDLDGSPFLLKAAFGNLDQATVTLGRYTTEGFTISGATLVAEALTFSSTEMMKGTGDVTAGRVNAVVRVDPSDLSAYLKTRGLIVDVGVDGEVGSVSGTVSVLGLTARGTAIGEFSLIGSRLQFRPASVSVEGINVPIPESLIQSTFAFDVVLPDVAGLKLEGARLVDSQIEFTATATNYVLSA